MSHPRTLAPGALFVLLLSLTACAPQQADDASTPASAPAAPPSVPTESEAAAESAEPGDASETPYEYEY